MNWNHYYVYNNESCINLFIFIYLKIQIWMIPKKMNKGKNLRILVKIQSKLPKKHQQNIKRNEILERSEKKLNAFFITIEEKKKNKKRKPCSLRIVL